MKINFYAFRAIYLHEMDRFRRTLTQSVLSPVLTTSLYFIVFGSVIAVSYTHLTLPTTPYV